MPICGQNVGVQIMSVTGPVEPRDLGVVLPHEHVFADLVRVYSSENVNDPADPTVAANGQYLVWRSTPPRSPQDNPACGP